MTGAELISQERDRQIVVCGWTAQHDSSNMNGELIECASSIVDGVLMDRGQIRVCSSSMWPMQRALHVKSKYGSDYISRLKIAGALIAAEIDRLQQGSKK